MLDFDLTGMYEVETKRLKEAVKQDINRLPEDFMFTSPARVPAFEVANCDIKQRRHQIFALFLPGPGVPMLSGILDSKKPWS
jgi:hypothetical protein